MTQYSASGQESGDDDDTEIYQRISRQMTTIQTPDRNIGEKSTHPIGVEVNPPEEPAVDPPEDLPLTQQEPLNSIEDETNLPPAGELMYRILHIIEWIRVSPMAELTNQRRLSADIKILCEEHGYSPQEIASSPIQTAQNRGDLPGES